MVTQLMARPNAIDDEHDLGRYPVDYTVAVRTFSFEMMTPVCILRPIQCFCSGLDPVALVALLTLSYIPSHLQQSQSRGRS